MNTSIILGLLQNTAILLAFGMLYDYIWARNEETKSLPEKLLTGLIIGGFGLVLILTPWTLVPGLVFDTRSVILSVSGLFFGPIPTIVAMLITGAYRIMLGGSGVWMGLAVIVSSGTIGILWRRFRPQWMKERFVAELIFMGYTVHIVMLACTLLLPREIMWSTIATIALPLLLIYPAGTMLLGLLMIQRSKNWQTRKALVQSEERWKFALEGAEDGVWDWNPSTGEVFYSSRWKSMLGYSDSEISNDIGEWEKRVHPDDKQRANDDLQRHLSGESPLYINIHRLKCKDGNYKWILDRGKIMQWDENGKPVRFIGTHTDITGRKQVEEELSYAKEKAEESDRLKMSFLNNISHEVRTPLNAIMGFSNLLNDDLSKEEKERFVRIINSNAEQLLGIINDVLEFSRLETENIRCEQSPFSLNELFDDLYHTMKPQADEKKLRLSVLPLKSGPGDLYSGDRNKIRQVLTSFISNAIKYTPEGFVELGSEQVNNGLLFFVRDSGIGIEPEHRKKVFERFYRTPGAQQLAARGTGLGLSIARQLVEIMGGTIGMKAREGGGSEFFMSLPLTKFNKSQVVRTPKGDSPRLSDSNILIAEDEDANFEFLKVILGRQVKKLCRARNGNEVLEELSHELPDLILMDLKMPGMDGYEATRRLRRLHPPIPVIALTAYSQPEEKQLAKEAGCSFFISKPIQKEILFEIIHQAIDAG